MDFYFKIFEVILERRQELFGLIVRNVKDKVVYPSTLFSLGFEKNTKKHTYQIVKFALFVFVFAIVPNTDLACGNGFGKIILLFVLNPNINITTPESQLKNFSSQI